MVSSLFDFSVFPQLHTQRLILREITLADTSDLFRIRGDYEVTKYNIGAAYTRLEQAHDLIEAIISSYRDHSEIRWGITLKGSSTLIGVCGYNYWIRRDYRGSIGYDLARAYWGRGIMSEAVSAIVHFGFTRMGLNRIEADADARNPASMRVLEKIGFQREGLQHEQFYDNGQFYDLVLFSLLKRDYKG
jgi:ribosomal-protein-alanine N-acetyltransferase